MYERVVAGEARRLWTVFLIACTHITTRSILQSLSHLGEKGHAVCRRVKLSNKSLSEAAARVVAEELKMMDQVSRLSGLSSSFGPRRHATPVTHDSSPTHRTVYIRIPNDDS